MKAEKVTGRHGREKKGEQSTEKVVAEKSATNFSISETHDEFTEKRLKSGILGKDQFPPTPKMGN